MLVETCPHPLVCFVFFIALPCEAEVSDVDIVGMKFEVVSTFPEQTQYVGLKFRWQLKVSKYRKQTMKSRILS